MKSILCVLLGMFLFQVSFSLSAHPSDWSAPVRIDSVTIGAPSIAVSPNGQIAIIGTGTSIWNSPAPLYISEDHGKTFQRRYEFTPPSTYYMTFYPNGIAYDTNNVLWVYWAWDVCSDGECTFSRERWLYLSRSRDSGRTFEHVLKMKRGFQMGRPLEHDPWMAIGKDNTIHLLRDTAWYMPEKQFTKFNLIYTVLPGGDPAQRRDYPLALVADTVEIASLGLNLCLPPNDRPLISFRIHNRVPTYLDTCVYTRFTGDGQFTPYVFNLVNKLFAAANGQIYMVSEKRDSLYAPVSVYYIARSTDFGKSFEDSVETNFVSLYIKASQGEHSYALFRQFQPPQIMTVYTFDDLLKPPVDSLVMGLYIYGSLATDPKGGIYVTALDKSYIPYFWGKDISTGIRTIEISPSSLVPDLKVSPNPFNSTARISFTLPVRADVTLSVYDIAGRKVHELPVIHAAEGENTLSWNADAYASGIYIFALRFNNNVITTKAAFLK